MVVTDVPLDQADNQEILARASVGDADAFCRLIQTSQARLLRQATALTGDVNAAEDLVSETLVEAWKCLSRYNQSCRLSTWLYAILLHRHQKMIRRARCRPISLAWLPFFEAQDMHEQQSRLPSTELSPAEVTAQNETSIRWRQLLSSLPEKHRQVILLRFFEDASLPDMAKVLGCSVGTVKSRLHHALERLRKMKMNLPDVKGDKRV